MNALVALVAGLALCTQPEGAAGPPVIEPVEPLLNSLKSADPLTRASAAQELGYHPKAGRLAMPALVAGLADKDERVRWAAGGAIRSLSQTLDVRAAVPALARMVRQGPALDRVLAASTLATMAQNGHNGSDWMKPLHEDPDSAVRGLIVLTLREETELRRLLDSLPPGHYLPPAKNPADVAAAVPVVLRAMDRGGDDVFLMLHGVLSVVEDDGLSKSISTSLVRAAKDKDPVLRKYALLTMGENDVKELAEVLPTAVRDPDEAVRCAAMQAALASQGYVDLPAASLLKALEDTSARVRVRAALALAQVAGLQDEDRLRPLAEVRDALVKAFGEEAFQVQDPAARGLLAAAAFARTPEGRQAAPVLLRSLEQEDRDPLPQTFQAGAHFQTAVADMLAAIGPHARSAVPVLLARLGEQENPGWGDYRGDAAAESAAGAVYALVQIGPAGVPELLKGLKSDRATTRTVAAMTLADLHKELDRAVPVLIASLRGPCGGRCVYSHTLRFDVVALAACGEPAVGPLLEAAKDESLRPLATEALGGMGEDAKKVVPRLAAALKSEDAIVRVTAAVALRAMARKAGDAVPALTAALDDSSPEVHRAACAALGAIYSGRVSKDDDLAPLATLKDLERLDLSGKNVTDAGMSHLADLRQLQTLNLWNTHVTDAGLVHLKGLQNLQQLTLPKTITDAGLVHLADLKALRYVEASQSRLTAQGVERLKQALPGCRVHY